MSGANTPQGHQNKPDDGASPSPRTPSDVKASDVTTWIFDLDNTLYPGESRLWPQIDLRITLFLSHFFGLDGISARALQKHYYYRYGTTLNGLMAEHGIDPHPYLDFAHDIDLDTLLPDPGLGEAIAQLPGRKLIFTNGSRRHASNVTRKLGFEEHFEAVFDIVDAEFIPKPHEVTYQKFLDQHAIDPTSDMMFEDLAKNLEVPHHLGMQTVLVLPKRHDPFRESFEQKAETAPYIHHMTDDLAAFLRLINPPA